MKEQIIDSFVSDTAKEHNAAVTAAKGNEEYIRATALVSMTQAEKKRFTKIVKARGLKLSTFFRLPANEYIIEHEW